MAARTPPTNGPTQLTLDELESITYELKTLTDLSPQDCRCVQAQLEKLFQFPSQAQAMLTTLERIDNYNQQIKAGKEPWETIGPQIEMARAMLNIFNFENWNPSKEKAEMSWSDYQTVSTTNEETKSSWIWYTTGAQLDNINNVLECKIKELPRKITLSSFIETIRNLLTGKLSKLNRLLNQLHQAGEAEWAKPMSARPIASSPGPFSRASTSLLNTRGENTNETAPQSSN